MIAAVAAVAFLSGQFGSFPPIARGRTDTRQIALTIDDGPNPNTTPDLLKVLRKYHAQATFFVIGRRVELFPDLLRQIVADGHEIGNHTMTHADLTKLSAAGARAEWSSASEAIKRVLGFFPGLCRPPGGKANRQVLTSAAELRMRAVYWTSNAVDFDANDVETVRRAIVRDAVNGGIVLLHDKVFHTVMALDAAIPALQSQGYEFVTVGDLAAMDDQSDDRRLLPVSWMKD